MDFPHLLNFLVRTISAYRCSLTIYVYIYIYLYIPSLKLKIDVVKVGVEQDRAGGTAPRWVHVQHSWENMAIGTNSLGELVEKNVWNRLVFYHSILLESSMNELALTQVGEMTCFNINHWGNPAPNSL